jgi:hypothetical protein
MLKYAVPKLIGGTGNQLFILGACIKFAEKSGRCVVFNKQPHNPHSNSSIADIFPSIPVVETLSDDDLKYEISGNGDYTFGGELQDMYPDARYVVISGYCQHPEYISDKICNLIQLPSITSLTDIPQWFIHIRRTDYVDNYIYGDLTKYWKKCIARIPNGDSVVILSDDLAWANAMCIGIGNKLIKWIMLDKQISEFEVLSIMSNCLRGGICANSTLSWWGVWLSRLPHERDIFMPVPWSLYNTDINLGLYVKGVHKISTE